MARGPFNNTLNDIFGAAVGGTLKVGARGAYGVARGAAAAAPHAAVLGASGAVALGATAARAGAAAAYGGYTAAGAIGNLLSAGRGLPLDWHAHSLGSFTFKLPTFNRAAQNAVVFGALGVAALGGALHAAGFDQAAGPQRGWRIAEQAAGGQLEIEKGGWMGATGSLALSMYRNRYGRRGMPGEEAGGHPNYMLAAHMADDVLRYAH